MLAQIYQSPESDELRAVYADTLSEQGDPRGEFIALQLLAKRTRAQNKRMTALLAAHRDHWLGPLEPAVKKSGLVFERGFVARAHLPKSGRAADRTGEAAWATLVELDLEFGATPASLILESPMRSLRVVNGVPIRPALELFAAREPLGVERLEVERIFVYERERISEREAERAVANAPNAMPRLRELSVRSRVAYDERSLARVFELAVVQKLATFAFDAEARMALPWLVRRAWSGSAVVSDLGWVFTVAGGSLRIELGREQRGRYRGVSSVLRCLAGQPLRDLTIAVPRSFVPTAEEMNALDAAVAAMRISGATHLPDPDQYY